MIESSRVFELLDIHMGGPFRWEKEDCFTGAANVFRGLTGLDLADDVRGQYRDEEGARAILGDYGGSLSVFLAVQAMRKDLKRSEDLSLAPIGAIGVSPRDCAIGLDGRCICIHLTPGIWATKSIRGYALSAQAETYWHV